MNDFPSAMNLARLRLFYKVRWMKPDATKVLAPPPARRPVPAAIAVARQTFRETSQVSTNARFRCPVLVFNAGYGKTDGADPPHLTPVWVGGPLLADVYEFVLVRDSGHWIWLDQPEMFLSRVTDFLKRYAPAN